MEKAAGAELLRVLQAAMPGVAGRIAGMPDLTGVLTSAGQHGADDNAAKERGLYVDLLADGTQSLPSDVNERQAAEAVARAREVGEQSTLLHDEAALAAFAAPSPVALAVMDAVFRRWLGMKDEDAETLVAFVGDLAAQLAHAEGSAAEAEGTS